MAVVHTPVDQRIKRVMERDSVQEEQVKNRIKHQMPPEELLEKADFIVMNDSSIATLALRVQKLFDDVMNLASS